MIYFIAEPAAVVEDATTARPQVLAELPAVFEARQAARAKGSSSTGRWYSESELNTAAKMLARLQRPLSISGYDADRTMDTVVDKLLDVMV